LDYSAVIFSKLLVVYYWNYCHQSAALLPLNLRVVVGGGRHM